MFSLRKSYHTKNYSQSFNWITIIYIIVGVLHLDKINQEWLQYKRILG